MEHRQSIKVKANFIKAKKEIQELSAVSVVEFFETESAKIKRLSDRLAAINNRKSCPPISVIKEIDNAEKIVEWVINKIPFIDNDSYWLLPVGGIGMWWAKVKVINGRQALNQLWSRDYELLVVSEEEDTIIQVNIDEDNIELSVN